MFPAQPAGGLTVGDDDALLRPGGGVKARDATPGTRAGREKGEHGEAPNSRRRGPRRGGSARRWPALPWSDGRQLPVLTLTESQERLLIAMTVSVNAHIRRGAVWAGGGRHRLQDLFALRAAGLASSAETGGDSWAAKRWQLNAKGIAEAQRIKEQAGRTGPDTRIPRPRGARACPTKHRR